MIGYDDIIDMEYVPRDDPGRLSKKQRAAQFRGFAAVKGHAEAIEESNRLTEPRPQLSDDELAELDRRLGMLVSRPELRKGAEITYFVPDPKKSGGSIHTVILDIRRIDIPNRTLTAQDGRVCNLMDIVKIRFAEEVDK